MGIVGVMAGAVASLVAVSWGGGITNEGVSSRAVTCGEGISHLEKAAIMKDSVQRAWMVTPCKMWAFLRIAGNWPL